MSKSSASPEKNRVPKSSAHCHEQALIHSNLQIRGHRPQRRDAPQSTTPSSSDLQEPEAVRLRRRRRYRTGDAMGWSSS